MLRVSTLKQVCRVPYRGRVLIPLGLLAVGCENELSVYTLLLENDLPTWSKKWAAMYVWHFFSINSFLTPQQHVDANLVKLCAISHVYCNGF